MISNIHGSLSTYSQQLNSKSKDESIAVDKTKETDRIESLKKQIQSGEYNIDTQKTAEAMAKDLI